MQTKSQDENKIIFYHHKVYDVIVLLWQLCYGWKLVNLGFISIPFSHANLIKSALSFLFPKQISNLIIIGNIGRCTRGGMGVVSKYHENCYVVLS